MPHLSRPAGTSSQLRLVTHYPCVYVRASQTLALLARGWPNVADGTVPEVHRGPLAGKNLGPRYSAPTGNARIRGRTWRGSRPGWPGSGPVQMAADQR